MNVNLMTNIIAILTLIGVMTYAVVAYPEISWVQLILGILTSITNYFIGKGDKRDEFRF